jgi:hypothetical protein
MPKKYKRFGIRIYKLCDSKGYTYMSVNLGSDRKHATATMTANHATVSGLTTMIENLGIKPNSTWTMFSLLLIYLTIYI